MLWLLQRSGFECCHMPLTTQSPTIWGPLTVTHLSSGIAFPFLCQQSIAATHLIDADKTSRMCIAPQKATHMMSWTCSAFVLRLLLHEVVWSALC